MFLNHSVIRVFCLYDFRHAPLQLRCIDNQSHRLMTVSILAPAVGKTLGLADAVSMEAVLADESVTLRGLEVGRDHLVDQLIECSTREPT